jgi:hypothetical protein
LEHDSFLGWQEANGELQLPQTVCDRLGVDIDAVAITTACVTKTPGVPVCAPWSSVTGNFTDDASAPSELDASDASDSATDAQQESDVFAVPVSNLLGIPCTNDAPCGPLTCVTTSSLEGGAAGPLGGICTYPCSAGAGICDSVKPGAICQELAPGETFCVEGCTPGAANNCSARTDMVCSTATDLGTANSSSACLPQCLSDGACSQQVDATFCNQNVGLCKTTSPGVSSIGRECRSDTPPCVDSVCADYPSEDGGTFANSCTATCSIGNPNACGGLSAGNACIWPQDPAQLGVGAAGQCMELCGCSKDPNGCSNYYMYCVDFPPFMDATFKAQLIADGWEGYCGPPVGPNGEAVTYFNSGC